MSAREKGPPIPIVAFVDWNAQIHAARRNRTDAPGLGRVLEHVIRLIRDSLSHFLTDHRFDIRLRLYCGWHKGFEQTPRRKELAKISTDDLFCLNVHPSIVVRSLSFGDTALGALEGRICDGTGSHFPATCRDRGHNQLEEKMVDTALVSDLVYCAAKDDDGAWMVVVGDDIDLAPGVYSAEGLISGSNRKIAYLRRSREKFLVLENLHEFNRVSSYGRDIQQ